MSDQPSDRVVLMTWGEKYGSTQGIEAMLDILYKARHVLREFEDAEFGIFVNVETGQIDFSLSMLTCPEAKEGETVQEFLAKPTAKQEYRSLLRETFQCQKWAGSLDTGLTEIANKGNGT